MSFADFRALCRRRRPETAERDLIGAWLSPRLRSVRSPVAQRLLEASGMIVVGVDVHKQSVTAGAIDGGGRGLDEKTVVVGRDGLVREASAQSTSRRSSGGR